MSGHSKWATTKRAKAVTDSRRAILFTKMAKAITVAAREKGGDPSANFTLRIAMEKARAANMPKDNIERAIKRGTGELESANIEEIYYEGFGPAKIGVIVKCFTDNKNRASSDIKHAFSRFGGSMASPNAVMWQFEQKGILRLDKTDLGEKNLEELELQIIDLGAQDIKITADEVLIYTKVEDLQKVNKGLEILGLTIDFAGIDYVPKETVALTPEQKEQVEQFFELLDENEDVDDYYTNIKE